MQSLVLRYFGFWKIQHKVCCDGAHPSITYEPEMVGRK